MRSDHVKITACSFFKSFRNDIIPLPNDYELQALLVQTIFNMRKNKEIAQCLKTAYQWSSIIEFRASSFETVYEQ
jgi:hypothetical protein